MKYLIFLFLFSCLSFFDLANAKSILGVGEKKVEINFKCFHKKNKFDPISFGLLKYNLSNKKESVLLFSTFIDSMNEYGYPGSEVYDLGKISYGGENFDNLKFMFFHTQADGKYYYIRRGLYKKNNVYEVSDSMFRSSKNFNRQLDAIIGKANSFIKKKNYDSAVEKFREYSKVIFDDIKNSTLQNDTKKHLARFIFECKFR